MDKFQAKYMKRNIQYDRLDRYRGRDMASIDLMMDHIIQLFEKEIVWDKLNDQDPFTEWKELQNIVGKVRKVIAHSNQLAKELSNE